MLGEVELEGFVDFVFVSDPGEVGLEPVYGESVGGIGRLWED